MANAKQETNVQGNVAQGKPVPQGKEKKKGGFLFGLFAVLTALLIMGGIFGGAFYFVIHSNLNGLGERYRQQLQGIPIVKMALPSVPDPTDPKYMTPDEIKNKYVEYKKKVDDLTKQLNDANKKIADLQKTQSATDQIKAENDKLKQDAQAQKAQVDQQTKQLADEKKQLDQLVATGNKDGFKAFYESMDKATAQQMYAQILQEQKSDDDAKQFAKLYASMDASAAAKIFEQLGDSKIDLVVNILKYMKQSNSAEILAAMDASFASDVTDKLSKAMLSTPKPLSTPTP